MERRLTMGRRPESSGRQLSRRAFIGMAAGGVLASYPTSAAASSLPRIRTAGDHSEPAGGNAQNPPSPRPSAQARTAEPSASEVTRAEIVTRYAEVAPVAWGLDVPGVVTRLPTQDRVVALTFDACGGGRGSGYDAAVIEALRVTGTPATLFLNERDRKSVV